MKIHEFLNQKFVSKVAFIDLPELCAICQRKGDPEKCAGAGVSCDFCRAEADGRLVIGVEARGLDGVEWARVQADATKELHKVAYQLLAASSADGMAKAFREYLGIGDAPADLEKELILFERGVIWPVFKGDEKIRFGAKLNRVQRPAFTRVVRKIYELIGEGQHPEG